MMEGANRLCILCCDLNTDWHAHMHTHIVIKHSKGQSHWIIRLFIFLVGEILYEIILRMGLSSGMALCKINKPFFGRHHREFLLPVAIFFY